MLIHPPHHLRKHGSISLSSPFSPILLFIVAITIPTCLVAQINPSSGVSSDNGLLNQYDLLLLTTAAQQSSLPAQSILLVDLSKAHPNRLIALPSIAKFLHDDEEGEDKPTTATNAKKGCLKYDHVSGDASRDFIYFSCDKAIGYLKIHDGDSQGAESGVVYRMEAPASGSITELHYFNHTLYWIEDQKIIKSLSTLNSAEGTKDVITTESEKIRGLTVNPSTGVLYYSTWPHYSRTNASIHEFDLASSQDKLLQSGLLLPQSVDSDGEGLYWISHPPGIYFTIEMMRLGSISEEGKTFVMRQAHQHGGSLAVQCGKIYWTDVVDKRVWVVDGGSGKSVLVSDLVLGANSGLGFLSISRGGNENCDGNEHKTMAHESSKDIIMIKKVEGEADVKRVSNKEKEALMEKTSYKVQNKGDGMVRLCSRGEAQLINCVGEQRFCIVFGFSSVPMCLSRESQPTPATTKTLLQTRFSLSNNSLNPPSATTSQHQSRVQTDFSSTSWSPEIVAIVSAISTLAVIMTIISLYMTLRVRSLSRKPIIRRRVVVSRRASESGNGGSGGQNNAPASVCEMIDIENCCNMNVCETPCYERTLLQPNNNSTSSSSPNSNGTTTTTTTTVISVNSSNSGSGWNGSSCGKEDKRCLLSI